MRIRVALAALLVTSPALAAPLLGPTPPLTAKAAAYERQEIVFSTRENGLFLDPIVNPPDVPLVQAFFAQTAEPDFAKQTGKQPFAVLATVDAKGWEALWPAVAAHAGVVMDRRGIARAAAWAPGSKPGQVIPLSGDARIERTAQTFVVRGTPHEDDDYILHQ